MKKTLLSLSLFVSVCSTAQNVIAEGFDTFANLATAGWTSTNQSAPAGASTWAQGGGTAFGTGGQAGGATSFTLCNFNSTTGSGTISNWLITPVLNLQNGDVISFYSRTGGTGTGTIYADRLQVLLNSTDTSTAGNPVGATGVGAFTTLAVEINPTLTTTGYPFTWTQYSYTVSGLTGVVPCKIGFRYFVTSGGPSGNNSNIIGIDTFSVDRPLSTDDYFKNNFTVYPNPSSDVVNIVNNNDSTVKNIVISDSNGRVVSQIDSFLDQTTQMNISNLSNGFYFLKVQTDKGVGTTKIVKN